LIFNEFRFLFVFLPIILVGCYWIVPARYRRELLLAASLVFYGLSGLEHVTALIAGLIWVYVWTSNNKFEESNFRLASAIIGPLAALFYYKYMSFAVETIQQISGEEFTSRFSIFENVLLPAGISFFTFQMIAFAIDRYRGDLPANPPFRTFALYICFFPQLVAGPILRFSAVSAAIGGLEKFCPKRADFDAALGYIVFGLAAKVLLADGLADALGPFSAQPENLSRDGALFVIFAYSFQIYFDFYGYSLVAIGLGRLFGFEFPDNFLRPYEARNPRDFWRRWHVSLSYWIRDYLYLSLGGNRSYIRNIIIVFAVCGLWHGAGWNFVVWGLYHAGLVAGYASIARWWDKMPAFQQRFLNFVLISIGWLLFQYNFTDAFALLESLARPATMTSAGPMLWDWGVFVLAGVICFALNIEKTITWSAGLRNGSVYYSGTLGLVFVVTLAFLESSQTFIYFRF